MTKAYMYIRVSTSIQVEGYSLDAQRAKIQRYAELSDIKIVAEYSDAGVSGKNISGRIQFKQMLEDIDNHKDDIDYVLVFKLSRFGRNAADTLNSLQFMQDHGVNLICVDEGIDSSKGAGKLIISVLSSVAEIERENIHIQTMAGRRQKALEGEWNGGFAPYGYSLIDGRLVIDETEAPAVRKIFEMYAETTVGAAGVTKYINENYGKKCRQNGYLTRFSEHLVRSILDNPIYAGRIAFGRRTTERIDGKRNEFRIVRQNDTTKITLVKGKHAPIVSDELWDKCHQKRLETSHRHEKFDATHEYILSGLLKCPGCSASMYGNISNKNRKDGTPYAPSYSYKCRNISRETGHVCTLCKQYSANKLEKAVRDIVVQMVSSENFADKLSREIGKNTDIEEVQTQIDTAEKEFRRLDLQKERIEAQLTQIDYTDPLADKKEESLNARLNSVFQSITEVESLIENLRSKFSRIQKDEVDKAMIYEFLDEFADVYDDMSDHDKKQVMQAFIDSIEIFNKGESVQPIKAIHFKFPLIYGGDVSDTFVYDIESNIFRPKESTVETCVLLVRESCTDDEMVSIKVDMDGISLDQGEYKPEEKPTYGNIKKWIKEKYDINVTNLYIAQVKDKAGIKERENYNIGSGDGKVPKCPPEKEEAIMDAFRHFGLI